MEAQPERGYLVLADVSGFTEYLATTELTHAHDILHDLLDTIVASFEPTLTRIEVEGDAVFAYAPSSRVLRGETVLEVVEGTYDDFRDRVLAIKRQTTCECRACRDIPRLDLKFIVHFGEYVARQYAGSFNLLGSDVNLAHRLLKNHVVESTGWDAYCLFSEYALPEVGIPTNDLHEEIERYEHLEPVKTYSFDLHELYEQRLEQRRVFVTREDADAVTEVELEAIPGVVWSYLNDPVKRSEWSGNVTTPIEKPGGRSGVGARNHCAHGKNAVIETIVDWKPFDYFTADMAMGKVGCRYTFQLIPSQLGTHLVATLKMVKGPGPMALVRLIGRRYWSHQMKPTLDRLAQMITDEAPSPGVPPELVASAT